MKTMSSICCLLLTLVVLSCTKKAETGVDSTPIKPKEVVIDGVTYSEIQIDYSGHSSEGGMIFVDMLKGKAAIIDTQILGERGKRDFNIDLRNADQTLITDTAYEYDKSIAEGDVNIKSKAEKKYVLKNAKLRIAPGGEMTQAENEAILRMYTDIMKTVEEQK